MAINKVEICGVNTAKLPILTNEQKETLLSLLNKEIIKRGKNILGAI